MWWRQFAPELVEEYWRTLHAIGGSPQVAGVDIGLVGEGARHTANVGVRVHLREEGAVRAVRARDPGARWTVMVTGAPRTHHAAGEGLPTSRTIFADPICPGIQVCNVHRRGGTLGLIVVDGNQRPYVLSSLHVLGSPLTSGGSASVVQPSPPMMLGQVTKGFCDVMGDVALATVDHRDCEPAQFGTGALVRSAGFARVGDRVTKSGIASDVTSGVVDGAGRYLMGRSDCDGMDGFRIVAADVTGLVARPGDSGALWYSTETCVGYGLHVAGEASDEGTWRVAIACHLSPVLDRLGVSPLQHAIRARH
jgi:hypothetical protein